MLHSFFLLAFLQQSNSANQTAQHQVAYLVLGGGGHTKVLMKLSVVFRICSGTSSLRERSLKVINGSEKIRCICKDW